MAKASRSRKNCVTPISKSRYSVFSSAGGLSADPFSAPLDALPAIHAELAGVGGRVVYDDTGAAKR